jgi:hypothetical protein
MAGWRGWAKGRSLWLPFSAWVAALVAVYTRWWVSSDGPWAPFEDPHYISALQFVPILAGLVAFYGILPRMDWIDAQAITGPYRRDVTAAVMLIAAFAAISPLMRVLFDLNSFYTNFVPENFRVADPTRLDEDLPFFWFVESGIVVAAVLGCTCLMVSLIGRTLGPISGLLCYAAILVIQGYRLAPALFPRIDQLTLPITAYATAALTIVLGLAAFRLSKSGTAPLSNRH